MNKQDINLLPAKYRFDFTKFITVRVCAAIIVCNLLFLSFVYYTNTSIIKKLNQTAEARKTYLSKIKNINSNFDSYKKIVDNKRTELSTLKTKEQEFLSDNQQDNSPVVDSLRLLDLLQDSIYIKSLTYNNGRFVLNGFAANSNVFYKFYTASESSSNIKEVNFLNLIRSTDDDKITFKVKITLEQFYD